MASKSAKKKKKREKKEKKKKVRKDVFKVQDFIFYFLNLIREMKTRLKINHITVHNNTLKKKRKKKEKLIENTKVT